MVREAEENAEADKEVRRSASRVVTFECLRLSVHSFIHSFILFNQSFNHSFNQLTIHAFIQCMSWSIRV